MANDGSGLLKTGAWFMADAGFVYTLEYFMADIGVLRIIGFFLYLTLVRENTISFGLILLNRMIYCQWRFISGR
jgi:hypothetical protein